VQTRVDVLRAPLSFELNQGQTDAAVKFLSRGDGYALFLTSKEAVFKLRRAGAATPSRDLLNPSAMANPDNQPSVLRMELLGASEAAQVSGADPLGGTVNYFIGNDQAKWRTGVQTYREVRYHSIYPGVDAVFYGNQRELEYDFTVAPGADPAQIALQFSGAKPKLNRGGDLILSLDGQEVILHKPVLYQGSGNTRKTIEGTYAVAANQVHFNVGSYDHSQPLVIDPVLTYLTYLGGSALDNIGSVAGVFPYGGSNPTQALGI